MQGRWIRTQWLGRRSLCMLPKYRLDPHIILLRQSAGFDARVVAEAVYLVLQRIFEGVLLTSCHGFRPGRGFHTALQDLRHWKDVSYFVKMTVRDDPDKLAMLKAVDCLGSYVEDELLIELMQRMVDTRRLELKWKTPVQHDGSLQGKGLSYLWTNIYLHQLDLLINQELSKVTSKRLQYLRHAGNILVGFTGKDKSACEELYDKVSNFVEARHRGLTVDLNRSGVTHYTFVVDYLGFGISFKPVLQPEGFEGEVHLQRLKRACEVLMQTRMEHMNRIYFHYRQAISQAIGKAIKEAFDAQIGKGHVPAGLKKEKIRIGPKLDEALFWDRIKLERNLNLRDSEIRGIQTYGVKIMAELKHLLKRTKHSDPYFPCASSTLYNELAARVLPPPVVRASRKIDETLKKFYAKVLHAERVARKTRQVDPNLIKNMSTGSTWFSCVDLLAPVDELKKLLEQAGFFKRGRETHNDKLFYMTDEGIVLLYAYIATSILKYYKCANNLPQIRLLVNYHLRYSCLLTITGKHKKSLAWTIERFSKDLIIRAEEEDGIVLKRPFPSRKQVLSMSHGYFHKPSPTPPWEIIRNLFALRRSVDRATGQRVSGPGAAAAAESSSSAA